MPKSTGFFKARMLKARMYMLLVATFAMFLSATGTLIGYDIEQFLTTKIYSLMLPTCVHLIR